MVMIKMLRAILIVSVITMLAQAAFAGRMLGGDHRSADFHKLTAKMLVILAGTQTVIAAASFLRKLIPLWIPLASFGLLISEVLEFAAGDLHRVAIHVPLGLAIFGGAIRQFLGVMQITRPGVESASLK